MNIEPIYNVQNASKLNVSERASLIMDAQRVNSKERVFSDSDLKDTKTDSFQKILYDKLGNTPESLLVGNHFNKRA